MKKEFVTVEDLNKVIEIQRCLISTGDLKFSYDNEALAYLQALDFMQSSIEAIKWEY